MQQLYRRSTAAGLGGAAGHDEPARAIPERLPIVVPLREVGAIVVGGADHVEKAVVIEVGRARLAGDGDALRSGRVDEPAALQQENLRDARMHPEAVEQYAVRLGPAGDARQRPIPPVPAWRDPPLHGGSVIEELDDGPALIVLLVRSEP